MTQPETLTIVQALADPAQSGLPRAEAEYILLHAMGRGIHERAWLRAHGDDVMPTEALQTFQEACHQRGMGMPIAYITGTKEFHGLRLAVDSRVLDPRPDTETLVDWALERIPDALPCVVADLGTGSGAIALALAHERPQALVWAVDACADALEVAQANASSLGLPVRFLHGHWLAPLVDQRLRVDVLVSNPPYIRTLDPHLPALSHEPLKALVSGVDGLDDIRYIIHHAPLVLQTGGWLLLEHGHDQAEEVAQLLLAKGFQSVASRNDLAGIARCTGGQWMPQDNDR